MDHPTADGTFDSPPRTPLRRCPLPRGYTSPLPKRTPSPSPSAWAAPDTTVTQYSTPLRPVLKRAPLPRNYKGQTPRTAFGTPLQPTLSPDTQISDISAAHPIISPQTNSPPVPPVPPVPPSTTHTQPIVAPFISSPPLRPPSITNESPDPLCSHAQPKPGRRGRTKVIAYKESSEFMASKRDSGFYDEDMANYFLQKYPTMPLSARLSARPAPAKSTLFFVNSYDDAYSDEDDCSSDDDGVLHSRDTQAPGPSGEIQDLRPPGRPPDLKSVNPAHRTTTSAKLDFRPPGRPPGHPPSPRAHKTVPTPSPANKKKFSFGEASALEAGPSVDYKAITPNLDREKERKLQSERIQGGPENSFKESTTWTSMLQTQPLLPINPSPPSPSFGPHPPPDLDITGDFDSGKFRACCALRFDSRYA